MHDFLEMLRFLSSFGNSLGGERTEDVETDIVATPSAWFFSTSQIVGRLSQFGEGNIQ